MIKRSVLASVLALSISVWCCGSVWAATANDCLVTQAADAAVQRQLQMIDAAKVNPADFFSGANSCISPQLMQSFDLSRFIPDLAGLLSGNIDGLLSSVLNAAKNQVCSVLNEQLSQVLQKLNTSGASFDSSLSGQLRSILGSSRTISAPSTNFGQYTFSSGSNYGNIFGSTTTTSTTAAATTTPVTIATTGTTETAVSAAPVTSFGSTLFGQ